MRLLAAFATGLALLCAAVPAASAQEAPLAIKGAKTLDADGVIALVQGNPDLIILDNRNKADFDAGRIEGAVRLIDTDITGEAVLAEQVKSKATAVLFYCNGLRCGRAAKASQKAVDWGYTNVHYYALGLEEWKQKGLPLVTR